MVGVLSLAQLLWRHGHQVHLPRGGGGLPVRQDPAHKQLHQCQLLHGEDLEFQRTIYGRDYPGNIIYFLLNFPQFSRISISNYMYNLLYQECPFKLKNIYWRNYLHCWLLDSYFRKNLLKVFFCTSSSRYFSLKFSVFFFVLPRSFLTSKQFSRGYKVFAK